MTKKRALGRGLDALLGFGAEQALQEELNGDHLKLIPVDLIQRGKYQPRVDMKQDTLQELAESIRAQGVVQPIVVRPLGEGTKFEIVAGERRWRATQLAGMHEIPALVRPMNDRVAMSVALIENIQREQLNPIEEARALERLVEEFEMTHQEVAEAVGRSRASVSNLIRLLELDSSVRELLESGQIEMGHARALAGLAEAEQAEIGRQIVAKALSVREAEQLVREAKTAKPSGKKRRSEVDPNVSHLQRELSEKLGAAVQIKHQKSGRGAVSIKYNSLDELDGILKHIK